MILRFFRLLLVVMAVAVVALISALTTMRFAIHGAEVAVPNLSGLTIAQAAQMTTHLGLNLNVENRFYSAETPAGRVLQQSPAAGVVVRREWHVRVTESLGPQRVSIPTVVGQHQREAAIFIRRNGLELGSQAFLPDSSAQPDMVIAQSPPPNASGVDRPRVSLLLSQPQPQAQPVFVMPDFIGQSFPAAMSAISSAGMKLAPIQDTDAAALAGTTSVSTGTAVSLGNIAAPATSESPAPSKPAVAPGIITAQLPLAGQRIATGDTIHLTVSR